MPSEREVLVKILELSADKIFVPEEIVKNTGVSKATLHRMLSSCFEGDALFFIDERSSLTSEERIKIAIKAIQLRADIERVCRYLTWEEFEDISIVAFEKNDFRVFKHFRFKHHNKRWEIDLLGQCGSMVAVVDCKHWKKNWSRSSITRIVKSHISRTEALSMELSSSPKKTGFILNRRLVAFPIILSLLPASFKFCRGVPIVPILQIQDFLCNMSLYSSSLLCFPVKPIISGLS